MMEIWESMGIQCGYGTPVSSVGLQQETTRLARVSDGYIKIWVSIPMKIPFVRGLFTSINPSYFDVNKKGVLLVLTHCHMFRTLGLPTYTFFGPALWMIRPDDTDVKQAQMK